MVMAVGLAWGLRVNGEDDGLLVAVGVVNPPAKACGRQALVCGLVGSGGLDQLSRWRWRVGDVCEL